MKKVMGSLSPSPSPSPSPSGVKYVFHLLFTKSPKAQLLRIQMYVVITIILLFALFLLGRIRRFVRFGYFLRSVTKTIYIMIPLALIYIMGLMHNASTFHILYPVWACALIYAYGGVMTMTACTLSDHDNTLSYFLRTLFLLFWTLYLSFTVCNSLPAFPLLLIAILVVFLIVAARNTFGTLEAFYLASKSKGLPSLVWPLVQYMRDGRERPHNASSKDYRYVVWGNPVDGTSIITTKDIWSSVGNNSLARSVGAERLGDMCLSYAYFRLMLRRFACCPLHESSQQRTRRFVREELLTSDARGEDETERISERVFSVIEVELAFLFDFFYTNSFVYSSYRFFDTWGPLWNAALLAIFGTVGISYLVSTTTNSSAGKSLTFRFHGHSSEVGVTRIVTLIFSALEIWKFVMVCFSNRKIVWLLCTPRHIRENWIAEKVTVYVWTIKEEVCRRCVFLSRPWKRKLGQYSFLESYGQNPVSARAIFTPLNRLVKRSRAGQHGKLPSVDLSTHVKQALLTSLLPHVQDEEVALSRGTATMRRHQLLSDGQDDEVSLSRGTATMRRNQLLPDVQDGEVALSPETATMRRNQLLSEVQDGEVALSPETATMRRNQLLSDVQDGEVALSPETATMRRQTNPIINACLYMETDAHVVLVWHIATCFCELICDPLTTDGHFLIATQLSKYCAYLVSFTPELLAGHSYTTECAFDLAVSQARLAIRGNDISVEHRNLTDMSQNGGYDDNIVVMGAKLASALKEHVIGSPDRGWKVMTEFWAELLLYLAPSDNVAAHGDYLARGGEFITHVWAILTHAGIVDRPLPN